MRTSGFLAVFVLALAVVWFSGCGACVDSVRDPGPLPDLPTEIDKTSDAFRERLQRSRLWRHPFTRPKHRMAGVATNLVYAVR